MLRVSAVLLSLVVAVRGSMEGFVIGGTFTTIENYPHSAFLTVSCMSLEREISNWICGSSLLNQGILLTAGHCVYGCAIGTHMIIHMGDENRQKGVIRSASGFILHENYDPRGSLFDISMIKLQKPVKFSSRIRRVAVMKRPPYKETAHLAGWGLINEHTREQSDMLKHLEQEVWKHSECEKEFGGIPKGTICASSKTHTDYEAQGDSGSALVVRGYIQIGLVSYKVPHVARNVIIFTDVGFFFDWISFNSKRLYCFSNNQ